MNPRPRKTTPITGSRAGARRLLDWSIGFAVHAAALIASSLLTACSGESDSSASECGAAGSSTIQPGTLDGSAFVPIADGDVVLVREGIQSGKWIMPALRAAGVTEGGTLQAEVILKDGREAGTVRLGLRFESSPDGSLLVDYVPIPIGHDEDGPMLSEIYGQEALLGLHLTDSCGREATSVTKVKMENGDPPSP